jgi:hypothetical protein
VKVIVLIIYFGAILLIGRNNAFGQSCCIDGFESKYYGQNQSALIQFRYSTVVFIGEVIESKKLGKVYSPNDRREYAETEIAFKVERTWKKSLAETTAIRIRFNGAIFFEKGGVYLVYAFSDGNILRTGFCSKTRRLIHATDDVKKIEENGEKALKPLESPKNKQ